MATPSPPVQACGFECPILAKSGKLVALGFTMQNLDQLAIIAFLHIWNCIICAKQCVESNVKQKHIHTPVYFMGR